MEGGAKLLFSGPVACPGRTGQGGGSFEPPWDWWETLRRGNRFSFVITKENLKPKAFWLGVKLVTSH